MPDAAGGLQSKTVAVIDIGSNSIRLVVAQVEASGRLEVLERMQRPVRLGHSSFVTGRLSRQVINAAIGILRDYRRTIDLYKAVKVRAVATSAVREATNNDAFLDRVSVAADLDVEVIEPSEESRLCVSAVKEALRGVVDLAALPALIVEIGGGSGLLTFLDNGQIVASEGYNLGAVRLPELLGTSNELPERGAEMLRHHIDNVVAVIKRTRPIWAVEHFIAIGGDARLAAQVAGEGMGSSGLQSVRRERLDELVGVLVHRTVADIVREYGVPMSSAETLTPALLTYQALLQASRAERMVVSQVSMRDGLLLDLVRHVTGRPDTEFAGGVLQSAESVGERYSYDAAHARHVAQVADVLFEALRAEHRLGEQARLLLRTAALLHEIGGYVSSRAHHKHSYYLIANSLIFGLRRDELQVVALVARYHRRSGPKGSHREFVALPREQRVVVNKLAGLLRVADALDRGHMQLVRVVGVEHRGGELVLKAAGLEDLSIEQRALERKADLFEDVYGMAIRLEAARGSEAGV